LISAPTLNAILNATSAVLLVAGYMMIVCRRVTAHKTCMLLAFGCSIVFLISYVVYHLRAGVIHFQGQGWIRPVYFVLLTTHTFLAIVIVPLAIITLSRALAEKFDRHRRIARWTLPIWLYVSVTGVIVYWLLYHAYAPPAGT
jgi:putative membrane protein